MIWNKNCLSLLTWICMAESSHISKSTICAWLAVKAVPTQVPENDLASLSPPPPPHPPPPRYPRSARLIYGWLVSFWSRANCSSCWLVSFYRHVLTAAPGGWSDYCHVQTAVLVVGPFLVKCSPQLQDWLDFGHVLFTVLLVGQISVTWSFSFLWLTRFWSRALSQSCIWQRQSAGTEVIVHAWTGGAKQLSNCKFIELKSFISPFSVEYAQLIALLNWSVLIL